MQARSLSFDAALADLASVLLRVALAQAVPDSLEEDLPERGRVLALAGAVDPESAQLYYQIAVQGRQDLPLAPDERAGFVMTLLRMLAFRPEIPGKAASAPKSESARAPAATKAAAATAAPTAVPASAALADWPQLVQQLDITGAARELARNAERREGERGVFDLVVPRPISPTATTPTS